MKPIYYALDNGLLFSMQQRVIADYYECNVKNNK